jgi:hypothetical protein
MDTQLKERSTPPRLELADLQGFLRRLWEIDGFISAGPTQWLYHYTDLGGMIGIIESHDFWLTNVRYSNDSEELTHGIRIVHQVIEKGKN